MYSTTRTGFRANVVSQDLLSKLNNAGIYSYEDLVDSEWGNKAQNLTLDDKDRSDL